MTYEQARELLRQAAAGGDVDAGRVLEASAVHSLRHLEQDREWERAELERRRRRLAELDGEIATLKRRIGRS